MKEWIGAAALIGALAGGAAMAKDRDGNELIKKCTVVVRILDGEPATDLFAAGNCLGLVSGAACSSRH